MPKEIVIETQTALGWDRWPAMRRGARDVKPAGAAMSMVMPDAPFGYLSVEEAFALGRRLTQRIAPGEGSWESRRSRHS